MHVQTLRSFLFLMALVNSSPPLVTKAYAQAATIPSNSGTLPLASSLKPEAKDVRSIEDKIAQRADDLESLNQQIGRLHQAGKYAEATEVAKRAVALAESRFGRDHPIVGTEINNLAFLYEAQGRYSEAEPLYKRALAIHEKALGPNHPDVAANLNNLAEIYQGLGRYSDAEPLFKRSLAIYQKALGPDQPAVAMAFRNLAGLYLTQGRHDEAEPLYKNALAIDEKVLGSEHPDVGKDLNNLAELYRTQGRATDAEPLYKRALAIKEKVFGPDHPDVASPLANLAGLYAEQGRYGEAEPLLKRAIVIREKALGPNHPNVASDAANLATLYADLDRYSEAEPLYKQALAIHEKALGPNHPDVGDDLSKLADLYRAEGRTNEVEPLYKRALVIYEKALGPDHPDVGTALNGLAQLYRQQGRIADAEALYQRALAIREKALGPDHPDVAAPLSNLAELYASQRDWARAADYWRRSTSVITRRAQRGPLVVGKALTGKGKSETVQLGWVFSALVKVVNRLASEQPNDPSLPREMFQTAQWAQSSEAAASLAQMAARGAKDDPKLAALVRERQDLVAEWQKRDIIRSASVAQPPEKRNASSEVENIARLAAIDSSIGEIDKRLAVAFPDYTALASPSPLSVEGVQAQLSADEALVLFLDTLTARSLPEETFIWVVTKNEVRWVRSDLGTPALTREVAALRCGLDYEGAWFDDNGEWSGSRCTDLLKVDYTQKDHRSNKPLPFDIVRAYVLYKALFGQVEDLIKDKRLLIVPSGPLTQLPFQVLVRSLPSDVSAVDRSREVARLGADFTNLSDDDRKRLQLKGDGVRVVGVSPGTAAQAAGLLPNDVVLSFDGMTFSNFGDLIRGIQAHPPGSKVQIRLWRNGRELTATATLGATTIRELIPRFLADGEGKNIAWFAREHATTVLPAVSSLQALRKYARQSHAASPYIGFGNPLLDGEPTRFPSEGDLAKLAREKHCDPTFVQRLASTLGLPHRSLRAIARDGRELASVLDLKRQVPLPETADELCEVAHDLGADPTNNLYIGAKATEAEVKQLSENGTLAKYRIIHFATHGALAGELSPAAEPGLIMTPPEKASEIDDGYLTASEIAALKLDADWVILSACNTAAGGTKGADALSGLARAFFYAGARSLLVSHWEVDSQSTVKLITKAVAELKADPQIGRAEALRGSMLAMIDKGQDSQAHPAFWAPFVLVGEGGAGR